jgi:hypothetical protein
MDMLLEGAEEERRAQHRLCANVEATWQLERQGSTSNTDWGWAMPRRLQLVAISFPHWWQCSHAERDAWQHKSATNFVYDPLRRPVAGAARGRAQDSANVEDTSWFYWWIRGRRSDETLLVGVPSERRRRVHQPSHHSCHVVSSMWRCLSASSSSPYPTLPSSRHDYATHRLTHDMVGLDPKPAKQRCTM